MPPALAHSPWTGEEATDAQPGVWDQTAPDAPAHPRPAATARPVAAGEDFVPHDWLGDEPAPAERFGLSDAARGVLLVVLAQGTAASLVLCVAAARLLGSGHDGLSLDRGSSGPLFVAAGFGFATAAALIGLHVGFNGRAQRLRHTTIVIALSLATAWPISGFALPAALIATIAIGLAAAYDRFRPPTIAAPPIPAAVLLAIVGTGLMVSGLAGARTRDLHPRPAPTPPAAAPLRAAPAVPSVTPDAKIATPTPTVPAPTPEATTAAPTPTAAAPIPTPTPAAPAPTPDASPAAAVPAMDPAEVVADYYRALDARRFSQAWKWLSPAVQTAFGGFAHWKAGFATTLESRPEKVVAEAPAAGGVSVRHVLVARDQRACGAVEQRFAVTWRLAPAAAAAGGWSAVSLHAAPLGHPACR